MLNLKQKLSEIEWEGVIANAILALVIIVFVAFVLSMIKVHNKNAIAYQQERVGCGFIFQGKVHDATTDFDINKAKAELDICLQGALTKYNSK